MFITANKSNKISGKLLLISLIISNICLAQYTIDKEVSFAYLSGTSTMHDWIVTAQRIEGELNAEVDHLHIDKINNAKIIIPIINMKSGKDLMDQNLYKAIKYPQFEEIIYSLTTHQIENEEIKVTGDITVAGVTKTVETMVEQEEMADHIKIMGEVKLNMSDFNIDPPEFLFGLFTTGNQITITFYLMFYEKN